MIPVNAMMRMPSPATSTSSSSTKRLRAMSTMQPSPSLTQLPDVLLARVLAFTAPRDVEAAAVASRVVARDVLPRYALWRALFRQRWAALNFPLDPATPLELDSRLRALFPRFVCAACAIGTHEPMRERS